jgi:hypothetical protein
MLNLALWGIPLKRQYATSSHVACPLFRDIAQTGDSGVNVPMILYSRNKREVGENYLLIKES